MNRNPLLTTLLIVAFAIGGLGSMCDPDVEPCPEGEYDCHGECIPVEEDCPPCPADRPIQCEDGTCVADAADCPTDCPPERPHRCDDGSCVADESECEDLPMGCRDDGTCDPHMYADSDLGDYPTGSYRDRLLNNSDDFIAINAFAEDYPVHYWLLTEVDDDGNPVNVFQDGIIVNRIFEFVNPAGEIILEQNPIIEYTPDDTNYSPLVQVWEVHVPEGYQPNTIKSFDSIDASAADFDGTGIWVEPTSSVIVLEVTDPGVGLQSIDSIDPASWRPEQLNVWKDSQVASAWMGFLTPHDDGVSVYVADPPGGDWWIMPEPLPATLLQPIGCVGQNVYEERNEAGNDLYSPVVTRFFVDVDGDCNDVPTNAIDFFDMIDNGPFEWSSWAEIVMVTAQFPY